VVTTAPASGSVTISSGGVVSAGWVDGDADVVVVVVVVVVVDVAKVLGAAVADDVSTGTTGGGVVELCSDAVLEVQLASINSARKADPKRTTTSLL
jgi:hypothetical protein